MIVVLYIGCFFWFLKTIVPIGVALIAFVTLLLGYIEYKEQGKQKKAEYFFELRRRFKENITFIRIRNNITNQGNDQISAQEMRDYIGFFEELQIMINSGLLKKETAYYMFGVYAVACVNENDIVKYTTHRVDDRLFSAFKIFFDDARSWISNENINPLQIVI